MYICTVTIEDALKTSNFKSEVHKASLNVLYTAWFIKSECNSILKKYGLTQEQYNVLRILKGSHPKSLCVKDIGSRMIERSSNVPRIMDKLVMKKLVKRTGSAVDKRETVHTISEAGLVLLDASTKVLEVKWQSMFLLSESDAKSLNALLNKLRNTE